MPDARRAKGDPVGAVVPDVSMSLDGHVAGPDGGDGGLHDGYFAPGEADARVILEGPRHGRRHDPRPSHARRHRGFVLTHTPRATVSHGVPFVFVSEGSTPRSHCRRSTACGSPAGGGRFE